MVNDVEIVFVPSRPFLSATVAGTCNVCDDARFIPVADDAEVEDNAMRPCPACAALHESAERITRASIPARFAAASFETLSPWANNAGENYARQLSAAIERCRIFAQGGDGQDRKPWVLLCGPTGTAKTHLLCSIARKAALGGIPVAYLSMNDIFTGYKEAGQSGEAAFVKALFNLVSTVPMLLIDEVGCGRTDTEMALTSRLIQRRYDVDLPLAAATNFLPRGEGERALSGRLYDIAHSRLVGASDVLPLVGQDFRQQQGGGRD